MAKTKQFIAIKTTKDYEGEITTKIVCSINATTYDNAVIEYKNAYNKYIIKDNFINIDLLWVNPAMEIN